MTYIEALILAIIEGITEFLPISSTGHMVIASTFMGISNNALTKNFEIVIQLGAIVSVVVLYRRKFFTSFRFYLKLGFAFLPAAVAGFFSKKPNRSFTGKYLGSCCRTDLWGNYPDLYRSMVSAC